MHCCDSQAGEGMEPCWVLTDVGKTIKPHSDTRGLGCRTGAMGKRQCCAEEGCSKGAQGSTEYCVAHGGGKRCQHEGCLTGAADGGTQHGITHGGSKRCQHEG